MDAFTKSPGPWRPGTGEHGGWGMRTQRRADGAIGGSGTERECWPLSRSQVAASCFPEGQIYHRAARAASLRGQNQKSYQRDIFVLISPWIQPRRRFNSRGYNTVPQLTWIVRYSTPLDSAWLDPLCAQESWPSFSYPECRRHPAAKRTKLPPWIMTKVPRNERRCWRDPNWRTLPTRGALLMRSLYFECMYISWTNNCKKDTEECKEMILNVI